MPGKDYKKELKPLYSAKPARVEEVVAPPLRYLMLDGHGDPSKEIGPVIGALYSVAYPLKFAIKARDENLDYVVMPPEALYHFSGPDLPPRDEWRWTVMLLQPVVPQEGELERAKAAAFEKTGDPRVGDIRLETLKEGRCVQALHVGPYSEEAGTMARMQAYEAEHHLAVRGAHHEIYLSDPSRVSPLKMKTILRQPVAAVA